MTVEAVLLDVGGVLVLPEPAALLPAVHAAGAPDVTAADLARGHYAGVAAMDRSAIARGITADWAAYHKALVASIGGDERVLGAVRSAYASLPWTGIVPGALDSLRRLADTGVALGIVSNSDGTVEEQLLTQRICQVGRGEGVPVVVILDSFVVGIEKPQPGIFHRALEAIGVPADRAVHVGDTGWADVAGARAAGVHPLHLDPHGLCPVPEDHDHVRSLDDVTAIVLGRDLDIAAESDRP